VDMSGVIAVVSAALSLAALPPLPERGLALETKAGVQLQSLGGRPLATLRGFDLAPDQATAHKLVLRDSQGRLFAFEGRTLRRQPSHRGCRRTDVELLVCTRTIRSGTGVLRERQERSATGCGRSGRPRAVRSSRSGLPSVRSPLPTSWFTGSCAPSVVSRSRLVGFRPARRSSTSQTDLVPETHAASVESTRRSALARCACSCAPSASRSTRCGAAR
jgi:hypothetical protein